MVLSQIVEPVGESQGLRICRHLAYLLDSPVDISAVHVQLLDDLAFERYPEAEYAMCGRMLRSDVDHIFLAFEERVPLEYIAPVLGHDVARGLVQRLLVLHVKRIE